MGYSFRLAAKVLLYASSHRQDYTYHGLCYPRRGALAGTRNSSMGPPWRVDPTTYRTMSEREREMFYLTTHSTHFIYGYMASDIWLRTILIVRKETRCRHIGYSYRLTARVLLYAPSHRQDNTYHGLCYTSRGALAGTRNSSMGPPHEGSIRRPIAPWANALPLSYVPLPRTMSERSYHGATSRSRLITKPIISFSCTTCWDDGVYRCPTQLLKSSPVHVCPLPVKPLLHVQPNDPATLEQTAFASQSCCPVTHSSTSNSETQQSYYVIL